LEKMTVVAQPAATRRWQDEPKTANAASGSSAV
jgi:hypothetical protein